MKKYLVSRLMFMVFTECIQGQRPFEITAPPLPQGYGTQGQGPAGLQGLPLLSSASAYILISPSLLSLLCTMLELKEVYKSSYKPNSNG